MKYFFTSASEYLNDAEYMCMCVRTFFSITCDLCKLLVLPFWNDSVFILGLTVTLG